MLKKAHSNKLQSKSPNQPVYSLALVAPRQTGMPR